MTLPPLIHRRDLQASFRVSSEAMRQMLASGRLPPLDVAVSDRVQGWYPQTLRDAGIKVPEPAEASQPMPASS
jgi:hypothetical protein